MFPIWYSSLSFLIGAAIFRVAHWHFPILIPMWCASYPWSLTWCVSLSKKNNYLSKSSSPEMINLVTFVIDDNDILGNSQRVPLHGVLPPDNSHSAPIKPYIIKPISSPWIYCSSLFLPVSVPFPFLFILQRIQRWCFWPLVDLVDLLRGAGRIYCKTPCFFHLSQSLHVWEPSKKHGKGLSKWTWIGFRMFSQ